MKISSTASDLVKRRGGEGPLLISNGDVNRNQNTSGALAAASKLGKRKAYLREGTRDQPILIDDDPIDPQEWSASDQGPANKKVRIDKTIQDSQRPQAIHDLTDDSTQSRWTSPTPEPSLLNTPRLSLQRLGAFNDILTDTLIDGASFPSTDQTNHARLQICRYAIRGFFGNIATRTAQHLMISRV
jgi:hypothetical protein